MVDEATNKDMSPEHVRQLIESGLREAVELGEEPLQPAPLPDAVPGFEIIAEIGRGGMGVVYKALQVSTKRVVALKVMLAGSFASRSARKRFQREVELAARFQHPSIVRVLESGLLPAGQQYYAMDYLEGLTLDRYIAASQPNVQAILGLFVELCAAVDHAHDHGVIHRDLKPGNVIIDEQGKPHILDFGLAKAADYADTDSLAASVSVPGQVVGTLRYISPEQVAGKTEEIDARTDVYALGVMLFEALTSSPPYDTTGNLSEIVWRILEAPPARPSSLSDRVDGELETIILKALEKEKSRRYQSARELGEDIGRYLSGDPIVAQPPSSLYILRKKISKHRLWIALAAAILVLGILTAWGTIRWKEHSLAQQHAREFARARGRVLKAQRFLDIGRIQDASELARALFTQYPDMPEACLVWAKARFKDAQQIGDEGQVDSVIVTLQNRLDSGSSEWAFRALLADIYRAIGNPAAVQLKDAPDTAEAWYLRSFATMDRDEALHFAEQAVHRNRKHLLAWERLAYLYLQKERFDQALSAAQTLIDGIAAHSSARESTPKPLRTTHEQQRLWVLMILGPFMVAPLRYGLLGERQKQRRTIAVSCTTRPGFPCRCPAVPYPVRSSPSVRCRGPDRCKRRPRRSRKSLRDKVLVAAVHGGCRHNSTRGPLNLTPTARAKRYRVSSSRRRIPLPEKVHRSH